VGAVDAERAAVDRRDAGIVSVSVPVPTLVSNEVVGAAPSTIVPAKSESVSSAPICQLALGLGVEPPSNELRLDIASPCNSPNSKVTVAAAEPC
jgi:hypothetical protein